MQKIKYDYSERKNVIERDQVLDLLDKIFKAALTNMFSRLKKTMFQESKYDNDSTNREYYQRNGSYRRN